MKKILTLMLLLCAVFAGAQVPTTPNIGLYIPLHNTPLWDNYMNPNFSMLDNFLSGHAILPRINLGQLGITQYVDYTGTTAPALPAAGFCRMYYDLASNQWTGLNSAGELCSSQNAVGSAGQIGYYAATGRKISPDACSTDGSGHQTCASYNTNGIGTAKIDFPLGTSPGNPSAGNCRLYGDSVAGTFLSLDSSGASCFPTAPVTSVFGRVGAVVPVSGDYSVGQVTGAAPLASPTFTGIPAGPTATVDTNTTQLSTTAFVLGQAATATPLIDGTAAAGTSTRFARADHVHPTDTTRAPLASPTFTGTVTVPLLATTTNCAATGTAADPSVVSCSAAVAGAFSCSINASATTCIINTTAVTANSEIFVTEVADEGTRLSVTCNSAPTLVPAILLASKSAGVSFTINMPTITVNPACFNFIITN